MPEATLRKFGYPDTVVAETATWTVLVRPQQPTLGSLVLVCREPVTAFGAASPGAFAGLGPVVRGVERTLTRLVAYEKINYLMLMMVDPDVHFHVIPRYQGTRRLGALEIADEGWPGPPALAKAQTPAPDALARLVSEVKAAWSSASD